MSRELFTINGKRKYLTQEEQMRFLQAASELDRAEVRTFCMTLAYTGCRISEALELTIDRVDLSAKTISLRTLKQRDKIIYRDVPVPDHFLDALKLVHHVQKVQKLKGGGTQTPLWNFQRTMAWKHISRVMQSAGITGEHATPKGLRHGFRISVSSVGYDVVC